MNAYSLDLRERIFSYSICHTIKETAEQFRVSSSTVYLLKKRFYETGCLSPKVRQYKATRLMTVEGQLYIQSLLAEQSDLTLEKLRDEYEAAYGIRVSIGTMYNTVQEMGFSYKKNVCRPQKRP